jgi:hypothetical protein
MSASQRFRFSAFQRFSLSAFALFVAPLAAQETLFNHEPDPKSKMRVEAVALFSEPPPNGFLPVRITVHNPREQEVQLSFSSTSSDGSYAGNGSELSSSFTIKAEPRKTTRHDLLIPCTTVLNGGGNQSVNLRMSGDFGASAGSVSGSYGDNQPAVLLSEPLYTPNASMLDSAASGHISSSRHFGGSFNFAGRFDARDLPEDWRAYSGYDGIALTDTDWGMASPGARNAILRWNRLGGELVIHALSGSSDLSTLGIAPDAKGIRAAERSFGQITVIPIAPDLKLDPAATVARFTSTSARLPALGPSIREDFGGSWPLQTEFGGQGYNYGLFILILVAFGIVVGPVNLFVFAKSGRRHRLFITTPIIALATSALLVGLIILIDGFGGRGIRSVLMEVRPDDGENSAYLFQEQISRTGVLLGGGFEVAEPALVTPVPLAASQWSRLTQNNYGGGMRYETLVRDGKLEIDGDWFQSRSEQAQLVRAIIPTRGRIEARGNGGPPTFLSTFDFPVETLYYRDSNGSLWRADNITPGKAFTCQEVLAAATADHADFISMALNSFSERTQKAFEPLADRNLHFVAVTTAAPGIDTLKGIKWQQTRTFITGPVAQP